MPPQVIKQLRLQKQYLKHIPSLFKVTGDLPSAINEARWLGEHVEQQIPSSDPGARKLALQNLCKRRENHEPLQYILGSQPFGELSIKCEPGVLIPRPETETYTTHLAHLLNSNQLSNILASQFDSPPPKKFQYKRVPLKQTLNILDLCTGTGCISLLLHAHLSPKFPNLSINGWDISPTAIALAQKNLDLNIASKALPISARDQVHFHQADIFQPPASVFPQLEKVDIIISNPPYISAEKLITDTTRSVREWEPRNALVPLEGQKLYQNPNYPRKQGSWLPEDVFYAQLLSYYSRRYNTCRALIMEIGDEEQARRVVEMAMNQPPIPRYNRIEIWRDFPDQGTEEEIEIKGRDGESKKVMVKGQGKMRTVVLTLVTSVGAKRVEIESRSPEELKRWRKGRTGAQESDDDEVAKMINSNLASASRRRSLRRAGNMLVGKKP